MCVEPGTNNPDAPNAPEEQEYRAGKITTPTRVETLEAASSFPTIADGVHRTPQVGPDIRAGPTYFRVIATRTVLGTVNCRCMNITTSRVSLADLRG
jgi:hypothetical protein